jgi:hypothetical protein
MNVDDLYRLYPNLMERIEIRLKYLAIFKRIGGGDIMSCKCAKPCDQYHGWECSVSGGECMFLFPDSKACAERYGEGPDVIHDRCEDCIDFYIEDNKRCCKKEPLSCVGDNIVKSKYIEDDTICCGGFEKKE